MTQAGAAPDVDLKSRGLPSRFVIVGVVITCVYYFYGRSSASGKEAEDGDIDEGEVRWVQWLLWLIMCLVQLCLAGGLLMLVVLVTQQRKILYVPAPPGTARSTKENPPFYRSPGALKLPYEDLMIPTEDGVRINAWLVYQQADHCTEVPYTLVYFHGNAGNIGHRLENIRDMYHRLNVNILIVDYRSYGDSEDGDGPSERGFIIDAYATYKWLIGRINNPASPEVTKMSSDRILFFGRSIGGAVGIRLMSDLMRQNLHPGGKEPLPLPAGLILENTFTSLKDMAVQVFPFLSVVRFLLRPPLIFDEWNSSDSLDYITTHHQHWCCCLLSGLEDQLVPPAQMVQLHTIMKAKQPPAVLKFFKFMYGGHNDTPIKGGHVYWESFKKFMAAVKESEAERLQNPVKALDKSKDD